LKILISISVSILAFLCTSFNYSGEEIIKASQFTAAKISGGNDSSSTDFLGDLLSAADQIYDSINLDMAGLSRKAFRYAYRGYELLVEKGIISNDEVMTICDFSQSSSKKRMYIIDMKTVSLLFNTYVAHGKRTGGEYARYFSNKAKSHQSSLGFYITGKTYYGENGFSLKMKGLEKGFNDHAESRNIVVHGSDYASEQFLNGASFLGRSYGCPAVPATEAKEIINTIKEGTCFFIYHPDAKYLNGSKILND
jgi:L,D-transpeptidase catalytic domain